MRENGHASGHANGATASKSIAEESARRAAALLGEDSPLRPSPFAPISRPSVEFVGTLGRLSEAFQQLRSSLQQVDQKIEGLNGAIAETNSSVDSIHTRLNVENARLDGFDHRLSDLELKQIAALDAIQRRVGDLTRQVSFALGLASMLAVLAVVALLVIA